MFSHWKSFLFDCCLCLDVVNPEPSAGSLREQRREPAFHQSEANFAIHPIDMNKPLFYTQIGFLDGLVLLEFLSRILKDDFAGLKNIAAASDAQRHKGILLD